MQSTPSGNEPRGFFDDAVADFSAVDEEIQKHARKEVEEAEAKAKKAAAELFARRNSQHSLELETEIAAALSAEICKEIDNEILDELMKTATAGPDPSFTHPMKHRRDQIAAEASAKKTLNTSLDLVYADSIIAKDEPWVIVPDTKKLVVQESLIQRLGETSDKIREMIKYPKK